MWGRSRRGAYARDVDGLAGFLSGDSEMLIERISTPSMREAAERQEFERAARMRDQISAMRTALERQELVTDSEGALRRPRLRGR